MKIAAAFFGAASLLVVGSTGGRAQEFGAQPLGLASVPVESTSVAFGCGPGFFPNRYGVCRPRFYGPRFYGYGRPWGYGYRRFGYGYGSRRGFY